MNFFTIRGAIIMLGGVLLGSLAINAMLAKIKPIPIMPDDSTIEYISAELDRRNVPDCVLEPIENGWKCTAHDGKVYKVRAK